MKIKEIIILILLFVFSDGFSQNMAEGSFSYKSCFLQFIKIEGETNLSEFALSFDNSTSNKVNVSEKYRSVQSGNSLVEFKIPVRSFEGNNHLLVNDFRDLVDAANHPFIFVDIEKNTFNHIQLGDASSDINFFLTIAGKSKYVKGTYKTNVSGDAVILSGYAKLKLSDFSIDPPEKMFGMLQVKDAIIIKFDILILSSNS